MMGKDSAGKKTREIKKCTKSHNGGHPGTDYATDISRWLFSETLC